MTNYEIAKELTALTRKFHNSARVEYTGRGGVFTVSTTSAKQLRGVCFDLALGLTRGGKSPVFAPAALIGKRYTVEVTVK